jgi:hypothetical protein
VLAHNRLWPFAELEADDTAELEASTARAWDAYDEALAQVAVIRADDRSAADGRDAADSSAALGAVARAALRFQFPPGDGQRLRHWWSARFPGAPE